jgi:hypothetical protein
MYTNSNSDKDVQLELLLFVQHSADMCYVCLDLLLLLLFNHDDSTTLVWRLRSIWWLRELALPLLAVSRLVTSSGYYKVSE